MPKGLSAKEGAVYCSLIESLLQIKTPAEFLNWARNDLQQLFPHEILICGVGRINPRSIDIHKFLSNNFPLKYLETIRRPGGGVLSPTMAAWCRDQKPQLFEPDQCGAGADEVWLEHFHRHGLVNIAAHGMRDLGSGIATYFSFSRIPAKLTPRHAYLLELLVPHLHVALIRVLPKVKSPPAKRKREAASSLTLREKEILYSLQEGKTNLEIAETLQISEKTVKNHVQKILMKLGVSNRTQAVTRALAMKIVKR